MWGSHNDDDKKRAEEERRKKEDERRLKIHKERKEKALQTKKEREKKQKEDEKKAADSEKKREEGRKEAEQAAEHLTEGGGSSEDDTPKYPKLTRAGFGAGPGVTFDGFKKPGGAGSLTGPNNQGPTGFGPKSPEQQLQEARDGNAPHGGGGVGAPPSAPKLTRPF